MKRFLYTFLLIFYCFLAFGQKEAREFKDKQLKDPELAHTDLRGQLIHYDFSKLFTQTDNSVVYGFIGDSYERLRVKFISVTKSKVLANAYYVYGKSMVKDNICSFKGTITITNIRKQKAPSNGVDNMYKNSGIRGRFVILGDYLLSENKKQNHSGTFKGAFATNFYVDKDNNIKYDDIDSVADNYTNNRFVGIWIPYKGRLTEKCNWGDFRIPQSGDLDSGAGEFSPADKYLKNGWQSMHDKITLNLNGKKLEEAQWWK